MDADRPNQDLLDGERTLCDILHQVPGRNQLERMQKDGKVDAGRDRLDAERVLDPLERLDRGIGEKVDQEETAHTHSQSDQERAPVGPIDTETWRLTRDLMIVIFFMTITKRGHM